MRAGLAIALTAALLAHGLSLAGGFVYDDHRFVEQNAALQTATVTELLLDPATHTIDADRDVYRPLRALGHAFDRATWGLEPFGYHLHSLLVHLAVVALGYACLRRVLPEPSEAPAVLGATLLAAHPLGVEVVAWISSRGDLYALAFALPALWLAVVADREQRPALALAVGVLALLATLGKESALWLPAVAWLHRRLLARPASGRAFGLWALVIGCGLALIIRQIALSGASPVQTAPHGGDLWTQVAWAFYGVGRTFEHLAWPVGLAVEYPQGTWAASGSPWVSARTWLTLALLVGTALLLRRRPLPAYLAAWALLAYLPSSSLLVTLRSLVNDRAAYPLLLPVGALLGLPLVGRARGPMLATAVALALVLVPLSARRTQVFHDDARLWQDVLLHDPTAVRAHLGLAAISVGDDLREAHLREAVRVAVPRSRLSAIATAQHGDFLLHVREDPEAAVPLLHLALELQHRGLGGSAPALEEAATAASLAEALTWLGRNDEAEAAFRLALDDQPGEVMLHIKRALLALWRWEEHSDTDALIEARSAWNDAHAVAPEHGLVRALAERIARAERTASSPP